jgi:hypothetical protein
MYLSPLGAQLSVESIELRPDSWLKRGKNAL